MVLRRIYFLHLFLIAPLLAARLTAEWPLVNLWAWLALAGATAAVWWISGRWAGTALVGFRWVRRWGGAVYRFFTERRPPDPNEGFHFFLTVVVFVPVALFICVLATTAGAVGSFLWEWWPLFAAAGLLVDLFALTVALYARGVFGRLTPERELYEAVRAVERFYTRHEADIRPRLPRDRFLIELRRRIPEGTGPEEAWAATAAMLDELRAVAEAGAATRRSVEAGLRRIDREIGEARRVIARHLASPIPDASAMEVSRLEEQVRDLEADRRELIDSATPALNP